MQPTKKLFGADGIRGVTDQYPFRTEDLLQLGQSLAIGVLGSIDNPTILLGTDTRESNQRIKGALVDGLTQAGIEIWDVGILPTSAISFLVASNPDLAGGVMISASHNPIIENGIKVFDGRGMKLSDDDQDKIEASFFSLKAGALRRDNPASVRSIPQFIERYQDALANEFALVKWQKGKILIDCANGAAYLTTQSVLSKLGLHHAIHNIIPDGTNINYAVGSEHVRKSPASFADELKKSNAELGIAFDGDADRVIFVDREGILYDGDMLLASLAFLLQDRNALKKDTVVITQMSNSGLIEHLQNFQIQAQTVRNGDKYITDVLVNDDLSLGGEQIGHIILHTDPWHVTGDGLRTALWVLAALARQPGLTLRDLTRGLQKWPQVNVSAALGGRIFSRSQEIPGLAELQQRVRREIPDLSRFECRPASTEPVYRIMLEARATPLPILAGYAYEVARYIQKALGASDQPVEILDCISGGQISPNSVPDCLE